jgi:hypothetical protein
LKKRIWFIIASFLLTHQVHGHINTAAQTSEESASRLCLDAIAKAEYTYKIPQQLLAAVTRVESGKADPILKDVSPWPWTLNVGGKGEYFKTKAEALKKINFLRQKGIKNFDVGCAQLNWQHQGKHFKSVEHMLDPWCNVHRAAQFLTELKQEVKVWSNAVGAYHNRSRRLGQNYCKKVFLAWSAEKQRAFKDRKRAFANLPTHNYQNS